MATQLSRGTETATTPALLLGHSNGGYTVCVVALAFPDMEKSIPRIGASVRYKTSITDYKACGL